MSGWATSTKHRRTTGSISMGWASARLRTTWRCTCESAGTSTTTVAADLRLAAEAAAVGKGAALRRVALLDRVPRGDMVGPALDSVLGELALRHLDLAATADAAAAAHRIEIDAEPARRLEHARALAKRPRLPMA